MEQGLEQVVQKLEGLDMNTIIFAAIGIVLLYLLIKLFKWPIKIILNGIIGVVLLYATNFIGAYFGFSIGINAITALIAGFLGIPGVIVLVLYNMFM